MIPFPAAVFAEAKRYVSEHAYHTPLLTSRLLSEQTGFRQLHVLDPLYEAWRAVENAPHDEVLEECQEELLEVVAEVKKAIREKVLESYRNGQKARFRSKSKQEK